MTEPIRNRSEILFLYDVKDANPNGDPLDEDRPRMDDETEENLVTDVRLKRTVRDYFDEKGKNVFIKEEKREDGTQKSRTRRLAEFLAKKEFEDWDMSLDEVKEANESKLNENIGDIDLETLRKGLLGTYLDLRLFGATVAVENGTITEIGPVQFNFGRSLHKVSPEFVKGTTVIPSKEGAEQGTMTEMWVVPYSLIGFHGIINENAAKNTGLNRNDVEDLLNGLWNGTKNLLTRSKKGHEPRLLMETMYREENYHIGELNKMLELVSEKEDKEIRGPNDFKLNLDDLIKTLRENQEKIKEINYKVDSRINFQYQSQAYGADELEDIFPDEIELNQI